MLNANEINARNKRKSLRTRLSAVLRTLAGLQKQSQVAQIFLDLACKLSLTCPIDMSKLPATPNGFVVTQEVVLKNRGVQTSTLCLHQVVSMALLYCWMYAATGDAQDARSCERYTTWLEAYARAPQTYSVACTEHLGLYLYPLKGTPEDRPRPPEWLKVNEGETV